MARCERIKQELDQRIQIRQDIMDELAQPGLPPSERAQLIRDLKAASKDIARVRREYDACVHVPMPRPDLKAERFTVTGRGSWLSVAGVIRNNGKAPAKGPFTILLGVSNGTGTRTLEVHVPPTVTIEGFGTEYTTPQRLENVPAMRSTVFHMLVDINNEVTESMESNNVLEQSWPLHLVASDDTAPADPA